MRNNELRGGRGGEGGFIKNKWPKKRKKMKETKNVSFCGRFDTTEKRDPFFWEEEEVEKEEFGSLRSFSSLFDKYKTNNTVGSSLLLLLP